MTEKAKPLTTVDPRWRVGYLLAISLGVFLVRDLKLTLALLAAQVVAWFVVGLPGRRVARQIFKLWGFALFLIASYALTREDPQVDRWVRLELGGHHLALNWGGMLLGLRMLLRIVIVILASQIARAGDAKAIATGLGRLGVPRLASISIDAVLALLGSEPGSGTGGGGGGGGGRGRNRGLAEPEAPAGRGFWESLKQMAGGNVQPLIGRLEVQIARAQQHAEAQGLGPQGRALVRDVGVIAGVSLTMLGVRALKILPSIPFAPGHKLVLLTPLYIIASLLTGTRWGGTLTGLTMGTVSFLMGDGKYGVFEILKHLAPGLICDLCLPLLVRGGRTLGGLGWSLFGGLIAVGRFATILAMTLLIQAPAVAYAILLPGLAVHVTFGVLSGYVTHHLVKATTRLREEYLLRVKEST